MQLAQIVTLTPLDGSVMPPERANGVFSDAPSFQAAMGGEAVDSPPNAAEAPAVKGDGWQSATRLSMIATSPPAPSFCPNGALGEEDPKALKTAGNIGAAHEGERPRHESALQGVPDLATETADTVECSPWVPDETHSVRRRDDTARENDALDTVAVQTVPVPHGACEHQPPVAPQSRAGADIAPPISGRTPSERGAHVLPAVEPPRPLESRFEPPTGVQSAPQSEAKPPDPGTDGPAKLKDLVAQLVQAPDNVPEAKAQPGNELQRPDVRPLVLQPTPVPGSGSQGPVASRDMLTDLRPRDGGIRADAMPEHGHDPARQIDAFATMSPRSKRAVAGVSNPAAPPAATIPESGAPPRSPANPVISTMGTTNAERRALPLDAGDPLDVDDAGLTREQPFAEARLLSGTTRPHGAAPVHNASDVRSVAVQIADVLTRTNERAIELRLHPEELGRVSLTLSGDGGSMSVAVSVDRADTLELMRRHIDVLGDELRRLGYGSVSFSFTDGQGGAGFGRRADGAPDAAPAAAGEDCEPAGAAVNMSAGTPPGGIDMRV